MLVAEKMTDTGLKGNKIKISLIPSPKDDLR